jgi:hypothetical protein
VIPIKASIRVQFSEALRPWLEIRDILRAVGGGPTTELQGGPLIVLDAKKRQRVNIQFRAFSVEQEGPDADNDRLERMLATVAEFAAHTAPPPPNSIRFDRLAIDPFELPFSELVARLRTTFLASSPILTPATDLQIVIDEQTSENSINHLQIGPMMPPQLNSEVLAIKRDDLPDQFLFVATGRTIRGKTSLDGDLEADAGDFVEWSRRKVEEVLTAVRTS